MNRPRDILRRLRSSICISISIPQTIVAHFHGRTKLTARMYITAILIMQLQDIHMKCHCSHSGYQ